ncbi:MAG TPA: GAF and ANTAR domain-containing protein, partial [Propionibacteriaceae bacterium]
LAEMALEMAEQPDVQHTVEHIIAGAQMSIGSDGAGVLLTGDGGQAGTAAATSEQVRRADDLQLSCSEGPSVDTSRLVDIWVIDDIERDDRFPVWGPQTAELGFGAALSVRLFTPGRTLGSLNLYWTARRAHTALDRELAQLFGRHASLALVAAQQGESMRAAVRSRHLIGQAQGILMERYRVDADRAFEVLRRYSQNKNVKLRTVAHHVIAHRRLPE